MCGEGGGVHPEYCLGYSLRFTIWEQPNQGGNPPQRVRCLSVIVWV